MPSPTLHRPINPRATPKMGDSLPRGPSYLRFLAGWDRGEQPLKELVSAIARCPVSFRPGTLPKDPAAVFQQVDRNPLDAVTQRSDGSWVLPYDLWQVWRHILEERYLPPSKAPVHSRLPFNYHLVPGALRMALYPLVAGSQNPDPEACPPHPAWPVEARLDTLRSGMFDALVADSLASTAGAGRPAVDDPTDGAREQADHEVRGPWPGGHRFPLLVTFDIDTKAGMKTAGTVLDEVVSLGLKPCFFLVGHGYRWDEGFCDAVRQAGGEIGLHGDRHDNRIAYESPERIKRRLDSCQSLVRRHQIEGFRSPSLLVSDDLYRALGEYFCWDSSVPDTDTNTLLGPRRGCGTTFPFRRQETLVLPTTMPADDRLLLLGYRGLKLVDVLRRKWQHIRSTGGLCHFLVHPEPHLFGKPLLRDLFRAVFDDILASGEAWVTTPSAVAAHWRELETEAAELTMEG